MAEEYAILIDPGLGITAAELARAWNEVPECAEAGECRPDKAAVKGFALDMADPATVALITLGTTLAKDLAVELVKRALDRAGASKPASKKAGEIEIQQVPDARRACRCSCA